MADNFKFSIIIAIYNVEEYLDEAINSIINQDIGFEDNVQLILIDDGSTDDSKEIALKYQEIYPKNIVVVLKENGGQSSARNLGLKYATGEYVNFLDSDDKLSKNTLRSVYNFFSKNKVNIISIPMQFFDNKNGDHVLNGKFIKNKIVDVFYEYDYPQLSISSCFIKTILFNDFCFDERFNIGEDAVLINKLLIHEKKIAFINDAEYFYRKRFNSSSTLDNTKSKKDYYLSKIEHFNLELVNYCLNKLNHVPKFIQYVLAYDLQWYCNDYDVSILSKTEYDYFMDNLKRILQYIDEDIIKEHKYIDIDKKRFLIYLKNDDFYVISKRKKVFLKSKDYTINRLHNHRLHIDHIEFNEGFLKIFGFHVSSCDNKYINIIAVKKDPFGFKSVYEGKRVEYPTTYRKTREFLNISWKFYYNFEFEIPIDGNCKISLIVEYLENNNSSKFIPKINFKQYANLSEFSNYYVKNNKIILFKDNSFHVVEYSFKFMFKLELISLFNILTSSESYSIQAFIIHLIYLMLFPFWKNHKIWIFMDRLDHADDNGEILFKYCLNKDDGFKKYYIINKNSADYVRLKKIRNVVVAGSIKHKLLYLFSEKIITSHPDLNIINPLVDLNLKLFSGLKYRGVYFLQHGVTKDNISSYLRKYDKPLRLITCVSDFERKSFLDGTYNYDEKVVQTLGFPRFDNLNNSSVKQIAIMPSWRHYFNRMDGEEILYTNYFINWMALLNNENFISEAKKQGYKIIFKPHPNFNRFLDFVEINNYIEIDDTRTYREIFNESALLITDYSSVFFDFAYLKKPIIYYHYDNDYHFDLEEGYFDYYKMGFGDVIKSEGDLVKKIINYMENGSQMEQKYISRVEKFFKFTDKNNCKRNYESIKYD